MSYIYVFGKNDDDNDYASMGLVGALHPTECVFTETANGESAIEMKHPIDEFGQYLSLQKGNILVVPVPVRTTPEIQNGSIVTRVWKCKVKPLNQLTSANQRTIFTDMTHFKKIKVLNAGEVVTIVAKTNNEEDRWKVKSRFGTGWMYGTGLMDVTEVLIGDSSQSIEEVQSPWTVMPQYFRIYEKDSSMDEIIIKARHIFYDLLYNSTTYQSTPAVPLQDAITGILNYYPTWSHKFQAYTNVATEMPGLFYKKKNIVSAFLDPEEGVCAKFHVDLIRDNYSLYFLNDPGINRGVRIQYHKNMIGINFRDSDEEVATRIFPIGEQKDGKDLYLTDNEATAYVDVSDVITDWTNPYPYPHVTYINCEGCKVGDKDDDGSTITKEIARARMRQQAIDLINTKCYEPKIEMEVEFLNLGDTEEYAQFRNLENCFLFDYVIVQHPDLGIDVTAQIVEMEWNCLLDRMDSVQIGSVGKTIANTGITSWQIPNGFSGSKIASNTVGSGALQDDIINARHIQSDSINTDAIVSQSITSDKIAANSINADHLSSTAVDTKMLTAINAVIKSIDADHADVGTLDAAFAEMQVLIAGSAEFDRATVTHLIAEALNLRFGVGEDVFIDNLRVVFAQMVSASIGNLCIRASNGNYYSIDVDQDGMVSATLTQLSPSEIEAGETSGGRTILDTDIVAENLSTTTLLGTYALLNRIDASRIDVDTLLARQAFIDALYTSRIFGGKSIEIIAGEAEDANTKIDDLQIGTRNYIRGSRALTGAKIYADYSDMTKIAHIIRNGTVERNAELFPVGSQIVMPWKDVDDSAHNTDATAYQVEWDIVRHGMVTLQDNSIVPGMFLQMHKCSAYGVQFSHQQAFYQAASTLSAGTYRITFGVRYDSTFTAGKSGQFTLTRSLPAGGRLVLNGSKVEAWASATAAAATESVNLTVGTGGTSLGTISSNDGRSPDNLNAMYRIQYGHNRWSTSAIRQYLNAAGTGWFSSREDFDIRPNEYAKHGFMSGFDSDFLNAIRPVKVTTALNTVEGYTATTDDTFDTFFLPSLEQMNVQPQLANAEGDAFDYWKSALGSENFVPTGSGNVFDAFKIPAINNNTAQNVYLRSAYRGSSASPWGVYSSGYVSNGYATSARCLSPVCVIC